MKRDAVRRAGKRRGLRKQRGAQIAQAFADVRHVTPKVPDGIRGPVLLRRMDQGLGRGLYIRKYAVAAVIVLRPVAKQADAHVAPWQ